MTEKTSEEAGFLTLGWKVTSALAPRYWLDPDSRPGLQQNDDLVRVPIDSLGAHTAIVAQSGSGKSFFLGRLVEEILLETRARCVIFDPNADFRRISETVPENRWKEAKYNYKNARGHLPHEKSAEAFSKRWSSVTKRASGGPEFPSKRGTRLLLPWPSLSIEFLAEDVTPVMRGELYHCHEFVKALAALLELKQQKTIKDNKDNKTFKAPRLNLIDEASRFLSVLSGLSNEQERKDYLTNEFDPESLAETTPGVPGSWFILSINFFKTIWINFGKEKVRQNISTSAAAVDYISHDTAKYYFGKAREYAAQRIVSAEIGRLENDAAAERLQVVDLPSFRDQRTRSLVLNAVLANVWENARKEWATAIEAVKDERVPTFIVLDEAHNLIPSQTRGLGAEVLREQFRAIAAEGRKYGLFLIVCTQRPDKIDPLVLSECENKALMKLGSRSVLEITEKLLGLEDVPTTALRKCLEFETGRAMLIGRWARGGPEILYSAMRRTIEGGTSLDDSHWGRPMAPPHSLVAEDLEGKVQPANIPRKKAKKAVSTTKK